MFRTTSAIILDAQTHNVEKRIAQDRPEATVTSEDIMKTFTMLTMARILTSTWKRA